MKKKTAICIIKIPATTIKVSKILGHCMNKILKLKFKKYLQEQEKYSRNLKLQLNTLTLIMLILEITTNRLNYLQRERNKVTGIKILMEEAQEEEEEDLNRVH